MKKNFFDASIHLGQFSLHSETMRVACKNSQAMISTKGDETIVGVCTFNENSWVDHIIWEIERDEQDIFYPFMDVFHSVKNIIRIPLLEEDIALAQKIKAQTDLGIPHALTCAGAIRFEAQEIHTLYADLLSLPVQEYMKTQHHINIMIPQSHQEIFFEEKNLEKYYQNAYTFLKEKNVDLAQKAMSGEIVKMYEK